MSTGLFLFFAVVVSVAAETSFDQFKIQFSKSYRSTGEEEAARKFFHLNNARAAEFQLWNPLATFGVTRFSDLDPIFFREKYASSFQKSKKHPKSVTQGNSDSNKALATVPTAIDWRLKGAVTPVANEGECGGGDPAFAAAANIEGVHFVVNQQLIAVSAQQMIDCVTTNAGCCGGWMDNIYQWYLDNTHGRVAPAKDYPYNGTEGTCRNITEVAAILTGYKDLNNSEFAMVESTATFGPMVSAVDASTWQLYTGGILTNCTSQSVDHAIAFVGYNRDTNPPYWIIKNSWGVDWGMEGYIYVEYGTNQCNLTSYPSTAFVLET